MTFLNFCNVSSNEISELCVSKFDKTAGNRETISRGSLQKEETLIFKVNVRSFVKENFPTFLETFEFVQFPRIYFSSLQNDSYASIFRAMTRTTLGTRDTLK